MVRTKKENEAEFLEYLNMIDTYQGIELTNSEKVQLESLDRDLLDKLQNKANENLVKLLLKEEQSRDYTRGYKHAIAHLISYFRKYNLK